MALREIGVIANEIIKGGSRYRRISEKDNRFLQYTVICCAGVLNMLLFGGINLVAGNYPLCMLLFVCAASLVYGWFLVYRGKAGQVVYRANTMLFLILLIYLIYLGGEEHAKLMWVFIAPSIMFFLLGRTEGAIGTTCFLILMSLYFVFQRHIPGGHQYSPDFSIRVVLTLVIISVFTFFYENLRWWFRVRMEQKNTELKAENSQRLQVEKSLRESEERYRAIYLHAAEGILLVNFSGEIVECNPQILRMLGYMETQLLDQDVHSLFHPDDLIQKPSQLEKLKQGKVVFIERKLRTRQGEYLLCEQSGKRISDRLIILLYRDITERKRAEKALEHANKMLQQLADQDGLTRIPNRRKFDETAKREWYRMQREKKQLGIILCDIDFFKLYNDHYGHQKGDECLKAVAEALTAVVHRPGDLVARYGGEEFVALLPDTSLAGCKKIAEKMRRAVEGLNVAHRKSTAASVVTMSFGVSSIVPDGKFEPNRILGPADRGLYRAKAEGRNTVYLEYECIPGVIQDKKCFPSYASP